MKYAVKGKDKKLEIHLSADPLKSYVKWNGQEIKVRSLSLSATAGQFLTATLTTFPSQVDLFADQVDLILETTPHTETEEEE